MIASHGISVVDLVGLNKASIQNFSCLGSLEVAQLLLVRGGAWWLYSHYNASLSSNWTELGLNLN